MESPLQSLHIAEKVKTFGNSCDNKTTTSDGLTKGLQLVSVPYFLFHHHRHGKQNLITLIRSINYFYYWIVIEIIMTDEGDKNRRVRKWSAEEVT